MLDALIGQGLDHHLRAAHFRHDLLLLALPSSHAWFEEIKKGLKSPCFRAPPRLAGGSSTPGDAPSYENDNPELPHDLRLSEVSCAPSCLMRWL
jgi:hypothetical protein